MKGGRVYIPDVVEQVAIRAQLADNHDRNLLGVFRYAHANLKASQHRRVFLRRRTYEADDSGMIEAAEKFQLLDIH